MADTITGGDGADVITGGAGADVFVQTGAIAALAGDTLDVVLGTDLIRITGANVGNADTTLTVTSQGAAAAAAMSELNHFTTALANDAAVVAAIQTVTSTTPTFYLVYNTADAQAQIWYDADSNVDGGETQLIVLTGVSAAQNAAFVATATNLITLV